MFGSPLMMITNRTMIRYSRVIDVADANTLIKFMLAATYSTGTNMEKTRPSNRYNGAPGGWGICNKYEQAIRSAQSQKLVVGGMVLMYIRNDATKANRPKYLFRLL